jgi:PAS domain S-box-containing protein
MLELRDLSERELAVLELASEGLTDREIADRLAISPATVSSYWVRIRGKLGHFTRTEFAAQYLRAESDKQLSKLLASNQALESRAIEREVCDQDLRMAQFYKAVLTGVPDALLVLNEELCIEFANDRACDFLGCTLAEVIGEPISKFFPQTLVTQQADQLYQAMKSRVLRQLGRRTAMFILRPTGLHARVTMHLNGVETPSGPMTVCVLRSFTDEIEAMRDRIEVVRNGL